MVFLQKRRARALAVALMVALLVPIAVASADYWDFGTRNNNVALNGYFITQSADDWDCDFALRKGANNWKNISLNVTPYLYEASEWDEGVDKYYGGNFSKIGSARDYTIGGKTRIYGTERNQQGWLEEMYKYHDDNYDAQGRFLSHKPDCYHNRNWQMCTVAVYRGALESDIAKLNLTDMAMTDIDRELERTTTHEVGHTLRLSHPPTQASANDGEGSEDGRNRHVPNGEKSVMLVVRYLPPLTQPSEYDKSELRAKWGRF